VPWPGLGKTVFKQLVVGHILIKIGCLNMFKQLLCPTLAFAVLQHGQRPKATFAFLITVSSTKISLLTVVANNEHNSKTSSKQQNIKVIEEKCYWNQP
jgi:hypothetical protein